MAAASCSVPESWNWRWCDEQDETQSRLGNIKLHVVDVKTLEKSWSSTTCKKSRIKSAIDKMANLFYGHCFFILVRNFRYCSGWQKYRPDLRLPSFLFVLKITFLCVSLPETLLVYTVSARGGKRRHQLVLCCYCFCSIPVFNMCAMEPC